MSAAADPSPRTSSSTPSDRSASGLFAWVEGAGEAAAAAQPRRDGSSGVRPKGEGVSVGVSARQPEGVHDGHERLWELQAGDLGRGQDRRISWARGGRRVQDCGRRRGGAGSGGVGTWTARAARREKRHGLRSRAATEARRPRAPSAPSLPCAGRPAPLALVSRATRLLAWVFGRGRAAAAAHRRGVPP